MYRVKPGKVHVSTIHYINCACFQKNVVDDIDIVDFSMGNYDKRWNIAVQV